MKNLEFYCMSHRPQYAVRTLSLVLLLSLPAVSSLTAADQPVRVNLRTPLPYQVFQREGFHSDQAHPNEPGRNVSGHADVPVAGPFTVPDGARCESRVIALKDAFGQGTAWAPLPGRSSGGEYIATTRVPGGGWYRLEVRVVAENRTLAEGNIEPFGVGEVLLIAGQSYAAGANDELLTVDEPQGRVVAFDVVKRQWRIANDPQPNVGEGGTIWPPLGNTLVPLLRTPVGFVNVAAGGTASRQWLPGEKLYDNLAAAGKAVGRFRAVLWQQGESDVIENVSTEIYLRHLTTIREGLEKEWGFAPPWLPAKSTLHPTVYNRPVEEGRIREAIDQLWRTPGFRPGPDTDILGGENRGGIGTRRHFSGIGQRRAALLWFAALWPEIHRGAVPHANEDGFASLFDGKSLDGWEGDRKLWRAEGESIVGDSPGIRHNDFLTTTRRYGNFELRLDFKLHGGTGNSGIQFRSERVPGSHEVSGYQADIGEKYWGCLYDESRRNKVLVQAPGELEQVLKPGDWNSYVIRAEGNRVVLRINGLQTVDYVEADQSIPRTGVIALQVHSGPALRVDFRRLRIKELPR
jgi:Domain of Unknown Function (DUF1080)/Carbohydrate esterase, sialic acid-specific acetylesterase